MILQKAQKLRQLFGVAPSLGEDAGCPHKGYDIQLSGSLQPWQFPENPGIEGS